MSFILGLDVGTAAGAAATKQDGRVQPTELGESGFTVPSTVVLHDDGSCLTGEDAQRVGGLELVRVARDLRRDPMLQADPIVVGGQVSTPYSMLRALYTGLVERVCQHYGEVPTHVVVTHPALPDGLRCDIVERIADELFPGALLVPEPVAAAVKLACDCVLPTEGNIVVYDLGGGTLDLAIVRRDGDRFSILGEPSGMSEFGGIDIDDMVLGHVDASLTGAIANLDLADPVALTTIDRLRAECRQAKEQLSTETEVNIDASLPENPALVTMRRHELEELLFPRVEASMDVVEQMVSAAGLRLDDIDAIALVGGSARIPLVPELLRARTKLPVVIDDTPDLTAALGAAQMVDDDASAASVFPLPGASPALDPVGMGAGGGPGVGPIAASVTELEAESGGAYAPLSRIGAYSDAEPVRSVKAADPTRLGEANADASPTGDEPDVELDDEFSDVFGQKANPRIRNALVGGSAALLLAAVVLVGLRNTSSTVRADEGGGGSSGRDSSQVDDSDGDRGRRAAADDVKEDASEEDEASDDNDDDDSDGSTTTDGAPGDKDGSGSDSSAPRSDAPPLAGGSSSTSQSSTTSQRPTTTTTQPTTTTTRPTTTTSTTTTTTTTTSTTTTTEPPGDN